MKKSKKILALVLSAVMLMLTMSCVSLAADGEKVTVNLGVYDGNVILSPQSLTVEDGIAEEYGYEVAATDHNGTAVDEPTVFDALVAAHKAYYGDSFTKETSTDYLVMSGGFITKAFGRSASASGFTVNGRTPNDGVYNELYGSYTSYSCDAAELESGDSVTYFYYQDTEYWSDALSDISADKTAATVGEEITLKVSAFSSWCGSMTEDVIAMNTVNCPGIDIYSYSDSDSVKIATTDENGNAVVTFSEAGTYQLYCAGSADVGLGIESPIVADWITVTVEGTETPAEPEDEGFFAKIWNFIISVFETVVGFISDVIGAVC